MIMPNTEVEKYVIDAHSLGHAILQAREIPGCIYVRKAECMCENVYIVDVDIITSEV